MRYYISRSHHSASPIEIPLIISERPITRWPVLPIAKIFWYALIYFVSSHFSCNYRFLCSPSYSNMMTNGTTRICPQPVSYVSCKGLVTRLTLPDSWVLNDLTRVTTLKGFDLIRTRRLWNIKWLTVTRIQIFNWLNILFRKAFSRT